MIGNTNLHLPHNFVFIDFCKTFNRRFAQDIAKVYCNVWAFNINVHVNDLTY